MLQSCMLFIFILLSSSTLISLMPGITGLGSCICVNYSSASHPALHHIWVFHSLFANMNLMLLFRLFIPVEQGLCLILWTTESQHPNRVWHTVFAGISMQIRMWLSTSLLLLGHYSLISVAACQGLPCSMVEMQPAYTGSYRWYPSQSWSLSRYLIA